jgi:hypothetical protein
VTVRTYPDLPVASAVLGNFSESDTAAILRTTMEHVSTFTEQGMYLSIQYFFPTFNIPVFVWHNHTQEELDQVTAPFLAALNNVTSGYTYESKEYSSFLEMYMDHEGLITTPIATDLIGGRILPRSLVTEDSDASAKLKDMIDSYVSSSSSFYYVAFRLPEVSDPDRTAVIDAWRESEGLVIPVMCVLISVGSMPGSDLTRPLSL